MLTFVGLFVGLSALLSFAIPSNTAAQCVSCAPSKLDRNELVCVPRPEGGTECSPSWFGACVVVSSQRKKLANRLTTNHLRVPVITNLPNFPLQLDKVYIQELATVNPQLAATLMMLKSMGVTEWGQVYWQQFQENDNLLREWIASGKSYREFYEANKTKFKINERKPLIRYTYTTNPTEDAAFIEVHIQREVVKRSDLTK
jgi:hypothetical protein